MSEYVSYSTTAMDGGSGGAVREALRRRGIFFHDNQAWATARERTEQLENHLEREMNKCFNSSLGKLATCNAHQQINRLEAMAAAFSQVEAFRVAAETLHSNEIKEVQEELAALRQNEKNQRNSQALANMAIRAQKGFEKFASDVQQELCQLEKKVMFETVSLSLHELGYIVEARGDFLKAIRGQTCIWAETNIYGELSMDLSGFSGFSCMKELARVEAELRKKGVMLQRSASQPHARPEGGALVKKLRPLFPQFKKIKTNHVKSKTKDKVAQKDNMTTNY